MNQAWALNPYTHLLRRSGYASGYSGGVSAGRPPVSSSNAAQPPKRRRVVPYRSPGNRFEEYKKRGYVLRCPKCNQTHAFASDALLQCPRCGSTCLEGLPPTPSARPKMSAR